MKMGSFHCPFSFSGRILIDISPFLSGRPGHDLSSVKESAEFELAHLRGAIRLSDIPAALTATPPHIQRLPRAPISPFNDLALRYGSHVLEFKGPEWVVLIQII
jgi:hypothetical protein